MYKWSRKIWAITAMAVLVCLLTIGTAGAWDENHLEQLLKIRHCPACDLSGADLSGKNLSGHNFYRANLKKRQPEQH
ncbi:MAG: pentapeptide repeat-containing protein [Desulfonatronovibrio sp.]